MKQNVGEARPMTSNRGANFGQEKKADPFYQTKTKMELNKKIDGGPDEQYKILEKVTQLFHNPTGN